METAVQEPPSAERFCPQCGKSCVPLDIPHLSKKCDKCERTIYFVRYAPGGGIAAEAGERLTIPAGFMTMSLDPAAKGKLFRPGLKFLLKQLFLNGHPKQSDDIAAFFEKLKAEAAEYFENCDRFKEVDLKNDEEVKNGRRQLA